MIGTSALTSRVRGAAGVLALGAVALSGSLALSQGGAGLEIRVLSSRPDLVSGGDALVQVKGPA